MIFVTVGAMYYPFDRMLGPFAGWDADEDLVVQHGTSSIRPARARCVDFMPFEVVTEHVRQARVVVTHAGVGSILVSLANGKRPVVVPRLRRFGEAVDDHQVYSARRLEEAGLVTAVEDPPGLPRLLRSAWTAEIPPPTPGRLVDELRAVVEEAVGARNGGGS